MFDRKAILCSSLILLVFVGSFQYTQAEDAPEPEDKPTGKSLREKIISERKRTTGENQKTTTPDSFEETTPRPHHTTMKQPRTRPPGMTKSSTSSYYNPKPYEPREDKYEKKYRNYGKNRYGNDRYENNRYGNDRYENDRYGNDRYGNDRYENDRYGNDRYRNDRYDNDYKVIGDDGIYPGEYGQDIADFGPVYGEQESMYASMNIWITATDDWEDHDRPRYRKKYGGSKYNKDKDYKNKNYKNNDYQNKNYKDNDYKNKNYKNNDYKDNDYKDKDYKDKDYKNKDDKDKKYEDKDYKDKDSYDNDDKDDYDYKKNDRKKRSYSRVQFPVRHFKDIRKFPHKRFPPLISIFPWLPIFYDKFTYQTFIFSPTGGIYILPPLINFYGQRFAVAQLIKWGYASLVSSGAPPPPNVNVAPLVQPAPVGGVPPPAGVAGGVPPPAGVVGDSSVAPAPSYDTNKNRFVGGVKTDFPDFKPRYRQTIDEGSNGYGNNGPMNRNTYGKDSNYGGTGRQEVYPQGGPQRAGGNTGPNY